MNVMVCIPEIVESVFILEPFTQTLEVICMGVPCTFTEVTISYCMDTLADFESKAARPDPEAAVEEVAAG